MSADHTERKMTTYERLSLWLSGAGLAVALILLVKAMA